MAQKTQNFANHVRFLAPWHFFAFPVLAINVVVSGWGLFSLPSWAAGWNLCVAIALVLTVLTSRTMNLTTQDRIIRNEERERMKALFDDELSSSISSFTTEQLIALRFASDDELPSLARRVTSGELASPKLIKKAVKKWRADFLRV